MPRAKHKWMAQNWPSLLATAGTFCREILDSSVQEGFMVEVYRIEEESGSGEASGHKRIDATPTAKEQRAGEGAPSAFALASRHRR